MNVWGGRKYYRETYERIYRKWVGIKSESNACALLLQVPILTITYFIIVYHVLTYLFSVLVRK
jgi:hypothetical protein